MNYRPSEKAMQVIEKQFTTFIAKTASGVKKDYYKRESNREKMEMLSNGFKDEFAYEIHCELNPAHPHDKTEIEDKALFYALRQLTSRQTEVITLVIIQNLTEATAAKHCGISQQRVNSIKKDALKKLRSLLDV